MANRVIVLGEGQGAEMKTSIRNASSYLQNTYKVREKIVSVKDVSTTPTLNDHGDKELSENQVQQQIIGLKTKGNLSPTLGSFVVGDSVRVKVKEGLVQVDGYYRVYGITVRISEEDDEEIELIFNPS